MNKSTSPDHAPLVSPKASYSQDLEQLLLDDCTIQLKPQGYSMYPLFIPGRDEALIERVPISTFKKGDVALYRRDKGILVLHRICRIDASGFYMVGDNQSEVEGPLKADQIRGRLVGVIRNGHSFSVENRMYRFLSSLWLFMLPARPFCFKLSKWLKKILPKHISFR